MCRLLLCELVSSVICIRCSAGKQLSFSIERQKRKRRTYENAALLPLCRANYEFF